MSKQRITKTKAHFIAARFISSLAYNAAEESIFEGTGLNEDEVAICLDAIKERCHIVNDTDTFFASTTDIVNSVLNNE